VGKLSEAKKTIDDAANFGAMDDPNVRLPVLIAAARVRAAFGENVQAAKSLEALIAEAKFRLTSAEFEARLALGEIEMKSSKTAAERARLAALEKEATAKGFLLVARKAHTARNQ
jgi:hypothetical protein